MRDRIRSCDDRCSNNGNCLKRNKNDGEVFPSRYSAGREWCASVVVVPHLLCIFGHRDGDVLG